MGTERPVLTARWGELLLLNFSVPPALIASKSPPGTEPDSFNGLTLVSVVGFRFQNARLFGVPIPGHTRFAEINLRYYVRRIVNGELRRGVVFVKEIVPRRGVVATANWLYNENYVCRRMQSRIHMAGTELAAGDAVEYTWQSAGKHRNRQQGNNRLAARVTGPLRPPQAGSLEEFLVEHYWGYVRGRDGGTREYRVQHEPWHVAPVDQVVWDCDAAANYDATWAEYLAAAPVSALVANGSPVAVFRGKRI
jgi:uncharacterized protein YqjF (DUF2071 family)